MSATPAPAPTNAVTWVCQESFRPDNTTSCIRYPKLKRCVKEGLANNLTFLCVDHDSIAVGGSGPVPLPAGIVPFQCTVAACPQEAPEKEPKEKKHKNAAEARSHGSAIRWAGVMVLAMVVAPMVLAM